MKLHDVIMSILYLPCWSQYLGKGNWVCVISFINKQYGFYSNFFTNYCIVLKYGQMEQFTSSVLEHCMYCFYDSSQLQTQIQTR